MKPRAARVAATPSVAGYSGTPLPKKLGIHAGSVVALVNAPRNFAATLGELPEGARLRHDFRVQPDLVVCFVSRQADLARHMPRLTTAAQHAGVWIAWPKKASGVVTDVTEDTVRNAGLGAGLVDHKVAAIDQKWSGLRFALRKDRGETGR